MKERCKLPQRVWAELGYQMVCGARWAENSTSGDGKLYCTPPIFHWAHAL